MPDLIFEDFLRTQHDEISALAAQSDLLRFELEPAPLPSRYVLHYTCKGLVKNGSGAPTEAEHFIVGIQFPDDYLRRVDAHRIISVRYPLNLWHPNVLHYLLCPGKITPGMPLVDLAYHIFEIITYHTWSAHDPLNPAAAEWARNQAQDSAINPFPLDSRPLRRRRLVDVEIEPLGEERGAD